MEITVGPNQFFWKAADYLASYTALAAAPVDRVTVGELVCSKRLPFYQNSIPEMLETLMDAGKQVAVTSLALITLKRERKQMAEIADAGIEVEINDLTALAYLPKGIAFSVGPLVNVYNEGTIAYLANRGATRICLPPELPLTSVDTLTQSAHQHGVKIEIWGHGKLPLAISGRCYHARLHGRIKDNCQFACEDDPDGLQVDTTDGQPFLSMNGVQTLSDTCASAAYQIDALHKIGVDALRLSPQSQGFAQVCTLYRQRLDGLIDAPTLSKALRDLSGDRLSDGFLTGKRGVDWSGVAA